MNYEIFEQDLQEYGELHVVVEEHEAVIGESDEQYIGLRSGNTFVDSDNGTIRVDDGRKPYVIDLDSVVFYTPAIEFPD
jgi:hypothetical protein